MKIEFYFITQLVLGQQIYRFIINKNSKGRFRLKIYEQYCDLEELEEIYKMCKKQFKDNWKGTESIC